MTAEERMAYFQGEKRRMPSYQTGIQEKNKDAILWKMKFFIAVILFVAFLSLDYTGYEVYGVNSERIVQEVTKDTTMIDFEKLDELETFVL